MMSAPLAEFPIVIRIPVLWGDQDLFGHVNNVTYLRWFESARVRYWDDTGIRDVMSSAHWGPILASVHCNYRLQLRYPDTVLVGARITKIGRTSLRMEHQVVSEERQKMVADGESIVVLFDYEHQRAAEISADLQAVIERTEGRIFHRPDVG